MIKQTFIHIASLTAGFVIIVCLTLIAKCKLSLDLLLTISTGCCLVWCNISHSSLEWPRLAEHSMLWLSWSRSIQLHKHVDLSEYDLQWMVERIFIEISVELPGRLYESFRWGCQSNFSPRMVFHFIFSDGLQREELADPALLQQETVCE